MPQAAVDAEFAALMGRVNPELAPEGLTPLTAENIEAEIDAMFSNVTAEDVALIGAADGIAARSLTGNLTAAEQAELEAADARALAAADAYFANAAAAQTAAAKRLIDSVFDGEPEDADPEDAEESGNREPVGV